MSIKREYQKNEQKVNRKIESIKKVSKMLIKSQYKVNNKSQ